MSRENFMVAAGAIVTHKGKVLLGKKVDSDDHPMSGQWHFPGGHIEEGEDPEESAKREVKEETGLEGEIFQLVEVNSSSQVDQGPDNLVRVLYHMEADSDEAEPREDLQEIKWVEPSEVEEEVGGIDKGYMESSERIGKFLEKLEKMPSI